MAKLLSADGAEGNTATVAARPLTPEYASPEQIRRLPLTTATDVYALGAILFELLTGERAHRFSNRSTREMERVVCEADPPRLSEITPKLPAPQGSDLEAIVSKAMRKEPALRYSSVEQLAADLERCWKGLPVLARQGTRPTRPASFWCATARPSRLGRSSRRS